MPEFSNRIELVDEEKFWYKSNQDIRRFNFNKDQFKKMFIKQLQLKLRNIINFDICSIKNKVFNDY